MTSCYSNGPSPCYPNDLHRAFSPEPNIVSSYSIRGSGFAEIRESQPVTHADRAVIFFEEADPAEPTTECIQSDSFMVVGYEPSTKMPGAIARLLLAAKKDGKLVYVGSVGTGFKHAEARDLKKLLDGMRTDRPAVVKNCKNLVFVRPGLVAEIEYRRWTDDGKLRHSSFKGMRDEADEASLFLLR